MANIGELIQLILFSFRPNIPPFVQRTVASEIADLSKWAVDDNGDTYLASSMAGLRLDIAEENNSFDYTAMVSFNSIADYNYFLHSDSLKASLFQNISQLCDPVEVIVFMPGQFDAGNLRSQLVQAMDYEEEIEE